MPTNTPTILSFTMLPPSAASSATTKVNGRTYTCAAGALLSGVPQFDVPALEANGWTKTTSGGSGATAARPANPTRGQTFYDTTVGAMLIWTGTIWAHEATGASS